MATSARVRIPCEICGKCGLYAYELKIVPAAVMLAPPSPRNRAGFRAILCDTCVENLLRWLVPGYRPTRPQLGEEPQSTEGTAPP